MDLPVFMGGSICLSIDTFILPTPQPFPADVGRFHICRGAGWQDHVHLGDGLGAPGLVAGTLGWGGGGVASPRPCLPPSRLLAGRVSGAGN